MIAPASDIDACAGAGAEQRLGTGVGAEWSASGIAKHAARDPDTVVALCYLDRTHLDEVASALTGRENLNDNKPRSETASAYRPGPVLSHPKFWWRFL